MTRCLTVCVVAALANAGLCAQQIRYVRMPSQPVIATVVRGAGSGPGGGPSLVGTGLQNGGFSSGLASWTVATYGGGSQAGSVSVAGGRAVLLEGASFLVTLSQTFTIPQNATSLSFDVFLSPGFDTSATVVPDAFEAALLDSAMHSVVPTWNALATSFVNYQENGTVHQGPGVQRTGTRVTLDISGVPAGTQVTLFFDQVGADADTGSGTSVDGVMVQTPPFFDVPSPCGQTISGQVGVPLAFTVLARDLDPLDSVAVTVSGLPNGAAFGTGPVTGNPASAPFTWIPGFGDGGTYVVTFTATDLFGATASCQVTLSIASSGPAFTSPAACGGTLTVAGGGTLTFNVAATDPDPGDLVSISVSGAPAGLTFQPVLPALGNPAATTASWTPTAAQGGPHALVFTATDLGGHSTTCSLSILVSGTAPVFANPICGGAAIGASVGVPVTLPILVTDADPGDVVTLSVLSAPSNVTFTPSLPATGNPVAATLHWTPTNAQAGSRTVQLRAVDGQGHAVTCSVQFAVAECYLISNLAPAYFTVAPGDVALVDPVGALWSPVTLESIPGGTLPTDPSFAGVHVYTQLVMFNPTVFPTDPVRMSNGLHIVIGGGVTSYGPSSGMTQWTNYVPLQGAYFSVAFSIAGF